MIVYIRHSIDEPDPIYANDPTLSRSGKHLAREEGQNIIERYGMPSFVMYSPYRRTRATVKYMLGRNVRVNKAVDVNLCRFFKESERANVRLHPSTMESSIPINETRQQFKDRVESLSKYEHTFYPQQVVWCVTHTTVYKRLARNHGVTLDQQIPYMDHFTSTTTNGEINRLSTTRIHH